jgi:hypothetical protein
MDLLIRARRNSKKLARAFEKNSWLTYRSSCFACDDCECWLEIVDHLA